MAFDRRGRPIAYAVGLAACGGVAHFGWANGYWGTLAGSGLAAAWLIVLTASLRARPEASRDPAIDPPAQVSVDRLILDGAPVPIIEIGTDHVRALNRAARHLFGADDRILPVPPGLLDPASHHFRYEGRQWRIDRVALGGTRLPRMIASLIDVGQEERVAEARASAEMIHVLGHELLNGLAPIVSLAESGEAALARQPADLGLLREILTTLGRRADSLQRFTEAYRELARLPAPRLERVPIAQIAGDMWRLFASRWPQVPLTVDAVADAEWVLDRDQIGQAIWALLQNAAEASSGSLGAEARVTLTMRPGPGQLLIEVQDNGPGVPPDLAARIFRPFHTTKPNGTGVGLSLARQIAQAHGGSLSVTPGPPAVFTLYLPKHAP